VKKKRVLIEETAETIEAPICMFGSYCLKIDDGKNIQIVHLEGLGV
jgi:hypothetical protein